MVAVIVQTSLYNIKNTQIRVACIGDSITELTDYPSELQSMLGDGYMTRSFGASGSTVLLDTYMPYAYQTTFARAKNFLPDIVVVMLGSNDARTDNFKSIDNFVADYIRLIKEIQSIKTNPQIFLVKPPPIFENELDLESANFAEILGHIEQIADQLSLQIIDVYSAMKDHPEYFQDGVHPNSEGATVIANKVYNAIALYADA
ncbi:MAG: hypothetical protein CW691_08935 [Candidatus Bathyarchaeum sp.]|nr:MAG: hypothetical protein CW691_08935 [Candidatus Bathyarchaeum sp.]